MIQNADIIVRLKPLIGQVLTSQTLHEALFREEKHKKILRRFQSGKHKYIEYEVKFQGQPNSEPVVDITLTGNPNTFRVGVQEIDGKFMIYSEPRISYTYI
jgi:hypothetical protein